LASILPVTEVPTVLPEVEMAPSSAEVFQPWASAGSIESAAAWPAASVARMRRYFIGTCVIRKKAVLYPT
jgi:hypothetical protein